MSEYDHAERKRLAKETAYYVPGSAEPLAVGDVLWDNDLSVVRLTEIAASVYGMPDDSLETPPAFCYPQSEVAWHDTERVSDGRRSSSDAGQYGRLARSFDGITAAAAAEAGAGSLADYRELTRSPRPGSAARYTSGHGGAR